MLKALAYLLVLTLVLTIGTGAGGLYIFYRFGSELPDYQQLANYEPPTVTRVHAGDGRLLAEFAREKRMFVPVSAIPKRVVDAFLAAEDKNFFSHYGIDPKAVARAFVVYARIKLLGEKRRPEGGSTITQQVAKNFLLTNEVSFVRKIKEAILALRIERAFSKPRILELYLNEIYLGFASYGVAAAALDYFDKSLDDLTLAEAAYLAALPKGPNDYHPLRNREAALARRNWVLGRMAADGRVDADEAARAKAEDLVVRPRSDTEFVRADYFAEEVRREILQRYGETALYEGGLSVRTTLDPRLQEIARRVLRQGLVTYDRRHGWRGPIARIEIGADWAERLAGVEEPAALPPWRLGAVLAVAKSGVEIGLADGARGQIALEELSWARAWRKNQRLGPKVRAPKDVLAVGDVVAVEKLADKAPGAYALRQIPNVGGGLVALDPHTGRVLAMVGGYSYADSEFNRATQAARQPGSAFKPIVYTAALENGFTPSSLILDGPFVIDQGPGLPKWKPANYARKFYGPSTLRLGVEKSRNLMTVRLAQNIGMDKVADYAKRFGVVDEMPEQLAMALGAAETSLLRLTAAYAMLVNGGRRITPSLIDRVQDRRGRTVFLHDERLCPDCRASAWENQPEPEVIDNRVQIVEPGTAYQIVSILQGVIQRGTGRRVATVGKPLGGKTGTTNKSFDTWFVGFSPDLTAGVYVGFDTPRTLGRRETGSSVAAPVFRDFMAEALKGEAAIPFRIPPGVRLVRVNAATGLLARPGDKRVIFEAFKPGTEPSGERNVLDGSQSAAANGTLPGQGTGGLY
jgi:penicillin-binding protein 1A